MLIKGMNIALKCAVRRCKALKGIYGMLIGDKEIKACCKE